MDRISALAIMLMIDRLSRLFQGLRGIRCRQRVRVMPSKASVPAGLTLLVLFLGVSIPGPFSSVGLSVCSATDNLQLNRLIEIEEKVSLVVDKNMSSCVAITDGVGFGSGVIVSESGLVLTAGHVMVGEGPYEVILSSGRTVSARPLGKNLNVDTGMVQITEPGPWPFVEMSDSVSANPPRDSLLGQWVVLLGHSGGYELGRLPPVRTGRVISRKRHQIITDAVLIGGDSGGPLFDLEGRLIAIHSSIGDSIAENRHVTVDIFQRDWKRMVAGDAWGRLPDLNEPGDKKRPGKMGVAVDRTTPVARIKSVRSGSPASEVGIRAGDVVLEFDEISIANGTQLIDLIKTKNADDVYPIAIRRNGRIFRFEIQLK